MRANKTADERMYGFLKAVLEQVNSQVPTARALAYDGQDARRKARKVSGALEREYARDEPDTKAMWHDYQRRDLYDLFCRLDRGELSAEDWTEQTANFDRGMPCMAVMADTTPPTIDELPRFQCKEPSDALKAKIAHALMWVAAHRDTGLQVRQCAHCEKLFLRERGGRRGRPREHCSDSCTNAYNTAQWRLANPTPKAKHK